MRGNFQESFFDAALDVGEGNDEEGALVPAGEENFLFAARVEERQGLVDVAEVQHGLAVGVHLC